MIRVLLFGAISIINGVACDEEPITLSQHHDTSVSLEPHESHIPYHHLNVRDGHLWNSNHGRLNIINQKNILPWEYQTHYSENFGNRREDYVHYINRNSKIYGHLLPFRDDLFTYNYSNPHLEHKLSTGYPNDGYKQSLPMIRPNYNNFLPYPDELYKTYSHNLDTHPQGNSQDDYPIHEHGINQQKAYFPRNNIYNRNRDIGVNIHGNKLNFENIYNPQHSPEYFKHYNTPEELLIKPNHYNPYLGRKIDYENLNHGDPYRHSYMDTAIAGLISRKYNLNSHIGKSEDNANTYYDGYKRSGVHIEQPLSLVNELSNSTPYLNPNLDSINNFNNYNSNGHSTYLGHVPKLPGNVQSPQNHHHPYVNHGTDTRYLHHGYSHDGNPRQAYRHFKDVAIAVKELIHQKNNYNPYIHAYNRYHAQTRLRHYGRSSHTETVGILMPHKERPYPYILPEYRRYNFNNEYDIKY